MNVMLIINMKNNLNDNEEEQSNEVIEEQSRNEEQQSNEVVRRTI